MPVATVCTFLRMKSLWMCTADDPGFEPLPETGAEVDVAIIGGGITGIIAAWVLKQEGKRVAVIEARRVVEGETGHTTAHLTALQDMPFRTILRKFGRDGMRRIATAGMQAIDWIDRTSRTLAIDCDFERMPAYIFTEKRRKVSQLETEVLAAREAGLDCSRVDELPLPFAVKGSIRFEDQGRFHPRKFLLPLAARVHGDGSFVFEHTRAIDVHDGRPCVVKTDRGIVRAKSVIGATDAVMLNRFFLQTKLAPYRTYVVAFRVDRELPGLFFDTEDPYHYIRTHHDAEGPLLIVGGADHRVGEVEDTARQYEALERFTRARFDVGQVEYRWSGQIEEPLDGLPYIGRNSMSSNLFVATGYSGNGMVNGTIAATLLSDLVLGRENPYADMLAATRLKPLASAKTFVMENADFPKHLLLDRLPAKTRSVADVPAGEGRIVGEGQRKVAVYRDDEGTLHAFSAKCPHMGCHVHWNGEARSWDCPCHGSRFDAEGALLHGPSTRGLKPVDVEEEGAPLSEPPSESPLP